MEKKKVNESQKGLEVSSFLGFRCGQHTWPEIVTQRREKRENWGNGTRKPTETATTKGPTSDWKGSLGQNGFAGPSCLSFCQVKNEPNFTFSQVLRRISLTNTIVYVFSRVLTKYY